MDHESIIKHQAKTLESSNAALPSLFKDAMPQERLKHIIDKEYFDPNEDQEIADWFSRFNTIRKDLWSTIESGIYYTGGMDKLSNAHDYQYFVLGYSAVCSLIRMDQFLLNKVATHSVIQRKLNQAFPAHRVERKQFNQIYKGLVQPSNAIRIHHAHRLLHKRKEIINQAVSNSPAEPTFKRLSQQERYLDLSSKNYALSWLKSRQLIWRRRGASARQKVLFTMLEIGGRIAAELGLPRPKKVTASIRNEVKEIVQAGDFFVTRHNHALTNLFLPGFWPHTALYVGDEHNRDALGITTEKSLTESEEPLTKSEESMTKVAKFWRGPNCVLEAQKDGVRFRPLSETLCVDAFVVIRPNFAAPEKKRALLRALEHAGKRYNFDFDFFRSDQLVCTEVIYRAYDGIHGFEIPLQERIGRKTLSAEDLLDLTLDTDWAEPIAIFGVGDSENGLKTGQQVHEILRQSYRTE